MAELSQNLSVTITARDLAAPTFAKVQQEATALGTATSKVGEFAQGAAHKFNLMHIAMHQVALTSRVLNHMIFGIGLGALIGLLHTGITAFEEWVKSLFEATEATKKLSEETQKLFDTELKHQEFMARAPEERLKSLTKEREAWRSVAQSIAGTEEESKVYYQHIKPLNDEIGLLEKIVADRIKENKELQERAAWSKSFNDQLQEEADIKKMTWRNQQIHFSAIAERREKAGLGTGVHGFIQTDEMKANIEKETASLIWETEHAANALAKQQEELERTDPSAGLAAGFRKFKEEVSATARVMETFALEISHGLANAFSTFFFDVMDSRIRSLKDGFRSLFQLIAQVLQQASAQAAGTALSGLFAGIFSSGASGGLAGISKSVGPFDPTGGAPGIVPIGSMTPAPQFSTYAPARTVVNNVTIMGVMDGAEFLARHAAMVGEIGAHAVASKMGTSPMFRSEMG